MGINNCLLSGYISRRIYKIINALLLSHKKDYVQHIIKLCSILEL